jgi:fructokinase
MGARAGLISRVSHDDLGADLIHRAQALNVDTRGIQRDPGFPTGMVTAEMLDDGRMVYQFPDECAWDHIRFTELERNQLDFADIVCFGTLAQRMPGSRAAIMAAISNMPGEAMCFLDLNLRSPYYTREIITPCLNVATVLKLNEDELDVLKSLYELTDDDETFILHLMEKYELDTAVLTRGAAGANAWSRTESAEVRGYDVPIEDTIGCGDAFAATFAIKRACGASLQEALEEANLSGAYVASQPGGTPVYSPEDLRKFRIDIAKLPIQQNADQFDLPLPSA